MRCGKGYGAVCYAICVVMHDSRTHRLYLCVGSTAPSLDILLLAINLIVYEATFVIVETEQSEVTRSLLGLFLPSLETITSGPRYIILYRTALINTVGAG